MCLWDLPLFQGLFLWLQLKDLHIYRNLWIKCKVQYFPMHGLTYISSTDVKKCQLSINKIKLSFFFQSRLSKQTNTIVHIRPTHLVLLDTQLVHEGEICLMSIVKDLILIDECSKQHFFTCQAKLDELGHYKMLLFFQGYIIYILFTFWTY